MDDFTVLGIKNLELAHEKSKRELEDGLTALKEKCDQALEHLKRDDGVDAHLLTNVAYLTMVIARYNLARDLLPYFVEEQ